MQDQPAGAGSLDTTADLLDRVRAGDQEALNDLLERHVPQLKRWASGRLPRWARDIADTSDLVQETIVTTLNISIRSNTGERARSVESDLRKLPAVADDDHPMKRRLSNLPGRPVPTLPMLHASAA